MNRTEEWLRSYFDNKEYCLEHSLFLFHLTRNGRDAKVGNLQQSIPGHMMGERNDLRTLITMKMRIEAAVFSNENIELKIFNQSISKSAFREVFAYGDICDKAPHLVAREFLHRYFNHCEMNAISEAFEEPALHIFHKAMIRLSREALLILEGKSKGFDFDGFMEQLKALRQSKDEDQRKLDREYSLRLMLLTQAHKEW